MTAQNTIRYNLTFARRMPAVVTRDESKHATEVHIVFIIIIRRQVLKNCRALLVT